MKKSIAKIAFVIFVTITLCTAFSTIAFAIQKADTFNTSSTSSTEIKLSSPDQLLLSDLCNVITSVDGGKIIKPMKRLAGSGRYQTMFKIIQEAITVTKDGSPYDYTNSKCQGNPIVLASGENFPDALSATALAGLVDGCVVITNGTKSTLEESAKDAIEKLNPSKVFIAGSEAAVSKGIFTQIENLRGTTPKRIEGPDRIHTAFEIYKEGRNLGTGWGDKFIVAYGYGYADALSAASMAYKKHYPILLSDSNGNLADDILDTLIADGKVNSYVLGSESVIPASSFNYIQSKTGGLTKRLGGIDRYDTCQKIVEEALSEGLTLNNFTLAYGGGFPDALCASSLCGLNNSVLLLVKDDKDVCDTIVSLIEPEKNNLKTILGISKYFSLK
ncbi:MAG: cell wall-binding repeat-containing protein, partial [Coriobacteriales bacterium]|nr:cell wall-binding repeat-containing protein [Coriobacteriales bacterium]